MLQDMLGLLCQKIFSTTQCKPVETQLARETESGDAGNCRDMQTGLQEKTEHFFHSKEISRTNVIPDKATVLIMVAPPTDLQQVGSQFHNLSSAVSCCSR